MRVTKSGLGLVGLLLAVGAASAADPSPLRLGEAVFRAQATVSLQRLPDGTRKPMQLDAFNLDLDADANVRIDFRSEDAKGVVVYRLAAGGDRTAVATVGPGKPHVGPLTRGSYALLVASDPPAGGAYLLSVAPVREPEVHFERTAPEEPAAGGARLLGQWQLGRAVADLDLAPGGEWLVTRAGDEAWLHHLPEAVSYRLPTPGGTVRRALISPDGWSVLVAGEAGATLLGLPDLTPFARFAPPGGLRDAAYAGARQRVALLPVDGNVMITSPLPDDLATVPGSAGEAIATDSNGLRLLVRRDRTEISVFNLTARSAEFTATWPAPPAALALHPMLPVVAGAGTDASLLWSGGQHAGAVDLPAAVDVDFGGTGLLALADGRAVTLMVGHSSQTIAPPFPATMVAFDPDGRRLVAATADGRIALWDTTRFETPPSDENPLQAARLAYTEGLNAQRARDYERAKSRYADSLALLQTLPQEGEILEFVCLTNTRLSQVTWLRKEYEESIGYADAVIATAAALPEGELRRSFEGMALYRRADALWELGRRDEAKADFRAALERGLEQRYADDARQRLAE